jgi:tetratricopeptide (TPR) repeat protein
MANEWLQHAPGPRELKGEEKWNVFLSYRSVNRAWVLGLYDVLTELGYKVFLDQYVLKPGDELQTQLEDALIKSQAGVLIWTNSTSDSVWVRKEFNTMERMAAKGFLFVPVKIEKSELPPFVENRIFIDFSDYPDGPNGGDLVRLIHAVSGRALSEPAIKFALIQDEESKDQTAKVNAAVEIGNAEKLKHLFEKGGLPWKTSASLGCRAAEGLIKLKKYDDAITMLEKLEALFQKALRPKQLKALALARRGGENDLADAQEIMGELHKKNHLDPETMGIYGRTWMDRYKKSNNILELKKSRDLYAEAFAKAPDDYYTGINAASKSVLIGTEKDLQTAAVLAEQVQKLTGTEAVKNDYWKTATIAESFLIQKKYNEAGEMYGQAVAMAPTEIGSHESTHTQAKLLMEKLKPADEERSYINEAFKHLS